MHETIYVLFVCLIIRTFQLIFLAGTIFFSHNKLVNNIFSHDFSPNRMGSSHELTRKMVAAEQSSQKQRPGLQCKARCVPGCKSRSSQSQRVTYGRREEGARRVQVVAAIESDASVSRWEFVPTATHSPPMNSSRSTSSKRTQVWVIRIIYSGT
jgi:hypothetical protein